MQKHLTAPVAKLLDDATLIKLYRAYPAAERKAPTKRKGKARGGKKESTTGADE